MNILSQMHKLNHLTSNEKTMVQFILSDPQGFLELKPNEIASNAYVSISTLYRLIDKLELNGINALKIEIVKALQETHQSINNIDVNFPILESDTNHQLISQLKKLFSKSIDETSILFDADELIEITQRIMKARNIDIYTSSSNIYFAQNFQFQMQEIGYRVNVPVENYIQRLSAANSNESDFPIIMSYGGRGISTQQVVNILNKKNIEYLLICSTEMGDTFTGARYKILIPALEDHYNKISSFSSRLSLLYVFDVLYTILFHQKYDENLNFKLENFKSINPNLK